MDLLAVRALTALARRYRRAAFERFAFYGLPLAAAVATPRRFLGNSWSGLFCKGANPGEPSLRVNAQWLGALVEKSHILMQQ